MKKLTRIGNIAAAVITGAAMLFSAGTIAFADTGAETETEAETEAGTEAEESIWSIPTAGMDITLPDSWKESGFFKFYQTMELEPELIVSYAMMYDIKEEELTAKEEELGDSDELYAYLDEHANDLFIILSVKDTMSEEDMEKTLSEASGGASFDREEIGKADGWTFYSLSGEDMLRRTDPESEAGQNMAKILEELPEMYQNIRFYEPEKVPRIEKGTKLSFKTTDFEGNEVDSEELFAGNTYTMVNLWTSWCTFCIQEMPELEEMNKDFAKENCGIIGVMMDGDEEEALAEGKRVAEEAGVTFPLLTPTEDMKDQLVTSGYPTTVFVDADGVVVSDPIEGMAPDDYRQTLKELLAGSGTDETAESAEAAEAAQSAETDSKAAGSADQGYSILVQDESGAPVPEAVVQFCSESECMMETTGDDGTASFDVDPGKYTIHILKAPEEFEKDTDEYQAPEEPGTVIITLKAKK